MDRICDRLQVLSLDNPAVKEGGSLEQLILKCHALTSLSIRDAPQISCEALQQLSTLTRLCELKVTRHPTLDAYTLVSWNTLCLTTLHIQSLPGIEGTEWVEQALLNRTSLKQLSITGIRNFDDTTLEKLTRLTGLEVLQCDCNDVRDDGFSAVAGMANLKSLIVKTQESLVPAHLEPLRNHTRLEELDLGDSLLLSSISAPATIRTLKVLGISWCTSILDADFSPLWGHPSLTKLDVSHCLEVASAACQAFASIATLKELNLEACAKLEDHHLASFQHHPSIRKIILDFTRINGTGFRYIALMRRIKYLSIVELQALNSGALKAFSRHPSLRSIIAAGCRPPSGNELKAIFKGRHFRILTLNSDDAELLLKRYPKKVSNEPVL